MVPGCTANRYVCLATRSFIKEEEQVACWVVCLCAGLKGLRTNKQASKTLHGISAGELINAHIMLYRTYCTGTVRSAQNYALRSKAVPQFVTFRMHWRTTTFAMVKVQVSL